MNSAPRALYPANEYLKILVFDARVPGATKRIGRERAAARELGDVEMLDLDHPMLIVEVGVASETPAGGAT
jgi:hypothetical protein